ncbi:unnamed protein product (macronuclear) [Paramecium tetraurelia]|uniref:Uncharacterized protein n=1 Tax=Paramecium tetraurelia TaxID=5888 RepID=A0BWF2_PARTE|nr:uncharacterized protein GSPATT00032721001 [Paramecium tetraurelia]CAK62869.1 unnamed protein product [Paramecium tetraurelia]|eukprot:XP_001430267.1 hypothetical protein (macronuclear) [Paramecium tetraurelia strain d4-2]
MQIDVNKTSLTSRYYTTKGVHNVKGSYVEILRITLIVQLKHKEKGNFFKINNNQELRHYSKFTCKLFNAIEKCP